LRAEPSGVGVWSQLVTDHAGSSREIRTVFVIIVTLLVGVAVAGGVVAYVAFPRRGEELPVVPQFGEMMRKGADALPVLDETRKR
jgi:hypothetical protein